MERMGHKQIIQLAGHNVHIMKRCADGHIMVIGHPHKQGDLSDAKDVEEEYLSQTSIQGDWISASKSVINLRKTVEV